MIDFNLISGIILVISLILPIIGLYFIKQRLKTQKYTYEGPWMTYGIIIGAALGIPLAITINMGMIGVGVAIGVAIGSILQQQKGKRVKITSSKREQLWKASIIGMISVIIGILVFAGIIFLI